MKKIIRILSGLMLAAILCTGMSHAAFAAEAAPSVSIPVEITVSGTLPDTAEDFTVVLQTEDAANPMPEGSADGVYSMTLSGAGTGSFPAITYTTVGIYAYRIYQVKGANEEETYDDTVYQLTVYITNAEDGSGLEYSAVLYPDEASGKDPSAAFANVYPTVVPATEPTPAPSDPPTTGDESNAPLYLGLIAISVFVVVLLLATRKRTRKTEE